MELIMKLGQPDYAELLAVLLPLAKQKAPRRTDGLGKLMEAIVNLPEVTLRPVVQAIAPREMNRILSALVADYEAVLLEKAGTVLRQQGIALRIRRLELSAELELRAEITDVDYGLLAEKFLPMVLGESQATGIWAQLLKAPKFLVKTILSSTPPRKLEEALSALVNGKSELLARKLENLTARYGLHLRVEQLRLTP